MKISEMLASQDDLSNSETEIANYILDHKEAVLRMSAQEICRATFTSTSSLVRLCRKIGLEGFKDFKIRYAAELERQLSDMGPVDYDFPFQGSDSILDIAQKMSVIMTNTLNSSYGLLAQSSREIKRAVDLIIASRRTALFGLGDSFIRGLIFRANMLKIDELILTVPFSGEHDALADILTDKDCAIVVSYSGNTRVVFDQVKILRRHRVPIIAVTSDPGSMIGKHAQIVLPMPVSEDKWNKQATFSSQTATEYVLNVLYSCIYVRKYGQSHDRRMRNIEEHRDTRF